MYLNVMSGKTFCIQFIIILPLNTIIDPVGSSRVLSISTWLFHIELVIYNFFLTILCLHIYLECSLLKRENTSKVFFFS